jgi:hypothetical protein
MSQHRIDWLDRAKANAKQGDWRAAQTYALIFIAELLEAKLSRLDGPA